MPFKVYDLDGNDVTEDRNWFTDTKGNLYTETGNASNPMEFVGYDYWIAYE